MWLTGDIGGVGKVGVGSRVERADAPVSPRRVSPTVLDSLRCRGPDMLSSTAATGDGR